MESLGAFEGRGRPAVVVVVEEVESRDERVEVKAWFVGAAVKVDFADLERGWP